MADLRDPTTLTIDRLLSEIEHLRALTDEKFRGRDTALATAMAAADRAVGKTETMFAEQIKGQNVLLYDVRDRIKAIEGRGQGVSVTIAIVFSIFMAIVAAASLLVALLRHS